MIMDKLLQFSEAQAITATAVSTNVIDLGVNRDLGVDTEIDVFIQVDTAFTAAGAATLTIELQTDDNVSFSSATALFTSAAIGKATLVAGYQPFRFKLPQVTERYLRLNYTVATGPMTAGAITAALVTGRQNWTAYDAVTGV